LKPRPARSDGPDIIGGGPDGCGYSLKASSEQENFGSTRASAGPKQEIIAVVRLVPESWPGLALVDCCIKNGQRLHPIRREEKTFVTGFCEKREDVLERSAREVSILAFEDQ
jgi:hypothetical protein